MNETIKFFELYYEHPSLVIKFNFILFGIILIYLIWYFLIIKKRKTDFKLVELTLDSNGPHMKYEIQRNYENLEIAHRIYTELITRKAALPIDYENEVIKEIYDSWYFLFQTTRNEIKSLSGKTLEDGNKSEKLIEMSTDILNKGLRPHLTKYQAKFRKWYDEELEKDENKGKCPQEIQKNFSEYNELVKSMKEVNQLLIEYSEQLHKFITGKK